jgi:uncharacterized protein (TIGR03083 family)
MDDDALWAAIDDQRRRTADLLDTLTFEQWQHPSLCDGWTVRHVAAHLTMQQQRVGDIVSFMVRHPRMLRSLTLNRTIHDSAVLQAQLPTEEIVTRIRGQLGSRRHNIGLTQLEPLTDALVHSQDIAIPLGLALEMNPEAAAAAATRAWDTRGTWLSRVFRPLALDGLRLTATDIDWSVGDGPDVNGPVAALLLLLAGRTARLDELTGPGTDALSSI